MTTVTFVPTGKSDQQKQTNMRRKDGEKDRDLINRAIQKVYGKSCFWFSDNGLGLNYGQVFKPVGGSDPANTSVTYRMRVDIDE